MTVVEGKEEVKDNDKKVKKKTFATLPTIERTVLGLINKVEE